MHVNLNSRSSFLALFCTPVATFSLGSIHCMPYSTKKKPTHILTSPHTDTIHTSSMEREHGNRDRERDLQTILFSFFFSSLEHKACCCAALHDAYTPYENSQPKQRKTTAKSFKRWTLGWRELSTNFFLSCDHLQHEFQPDVPDMIFGSIYYTAMNQDRFLHASNTPKRSWKGIVIRNLIQ